MPSAALPVSQVRGVGVITEGQLELAVRHLLKLFNWRYLHVYDSRRSEPGWPDIFAVRGERCIIRELKSGIGKLTLAQEAWLSALKAAGLDTDVWRPSDLDSGRIMQELR